MRKPINLRLSFSPAVITAALVGLLLVLSVCLTSGSVFAQSARSLTPVQVEIQKQQQRLNSGDEEERRDAVMRLAAMHVADASRAAIPALSDRSPIIRATAANAIRSIGADESVAVLSPLANDKDEFVRREAAYSLGLTHSRSATPILTRLLLNDKDDGVRGAAAVALGEIADESAVIALVGTLAPELSGSIKEKRRRERNAFVLRAAAVALGQIGSRAGTTALISAISNERLPDDVRREAARSLGLIGDPAAVPALKAASIASDPYLALVAHESLRKISP